MQNREDGASAAASPTPGLLSWEASVTSLEPGSPATATPASHLGRPAPVQERVPGPAEQDPGPLVGAPPGASPGLPGPGAPDPGALPPIPRVAGKTEGGGVHKFDPPAAPPGAVPGLWHDVVVAAGETLAVSSHDRHLYLHLFIERPRCTFALPGSGGGGSAAASKRPAHPPFTLPYGG